MNSVNFCGIRFLINQYNNFYVSIEQTNTDAVSMPYFKNKDIKIFSFMIAVICLLFYTPHLYYFYL